MAFTSGSVDAVCFGVGDGGVVSFLLLLALVRACSVVTVGPSEGTVGVDDEDEDMGFHTTLLCLSANEP